VRGETGEAFCKREQGTWAAARVAEGVDRCHAVTATDAVNSGQVTETAVNNDVATESSSDNRLNGWIVVVTVITQANNNDDGSSHFQTFVDITGDSTPTETQLTAVCEALQKSVSTHINIPVTEIKCKLNPKTAKRALAAMTSSYVADMTVNAPASQDSASSAVLSLGVALIAAVLLA